MRIVLVGTGLLGVSLLRPLLGTKHEVVALVQDGRKTKGYKRWLIPLITRFIGSSHGVTGWAKRHRIPIVWIDRMTEEELAPLRALKPDLLLTGGFGIILKKPMLELPKIGCVNTHSSLLPRHRGPNPFYAVIAQGEDESGVTFHIMEEGIDSGPIVAQYPFPVKPKDTVLHVYRRACLVAEEYVVEVVDRIEREGLHGTPQDESRQSYDKKPKAEDAVLDFSRPAEELERLVRAMAPSPMPHFVYKGQMIRVARVEYDEEPVDGEPGTILGDKVPAKIATGRGTLILRVAYARKPITWLWPSPWNKAKVGDRVG